MALEHHENPLDAEVGSLRLCRTGPATPEGNASSSPKQIRDKPATIHVFTLARSPVSRLGRCGQRGKMFLAIRFAARANK
jgi:hypothetical protein